MSRRILLIEDSSHLRQILTFTLEFKGYEVQEAADGRQGLERVHNSEQPYDLIFCDLAMPVMNGVEFVRRYRAEQGSEVPIILITAEGEELISEAMKAGANGCVVKPFEPVRLLEEIEHHLR